MVKKTVHKCPADKTSVTTRATIAAQRVFDPQTYHNNIFFDVKLVRKPKRAKAMAL